MAKKKLKGIVWPNLPNDTYILDAGEVEYSTSDTYAAGSAGKALQNKADKAGTYSELTSGTAETILSDATTENITPYSFRKTPVNADREYLDKVVGGSVAFNQKFRNPHATATISGVTFTNNGDGSFTINGTATADVNFTAYDNSGPAVSGHIYYFAGCPSGGSMETYFQYDGYTHRDKGDGYVGELTLERSYFAIKSGVTISNKKFTPQLIDLTQAFGSTVADAIYAMETATAGSGVAYLKSVAPKMFSQYNAYDAGSIKSVEATAHKTVGFNAWDEEWEVGGYNFTTGEKSSSSSQIRSANLFAVLPNAQYYVKSPQVLYGLFYDADSNYLGYETDLSANSTFTTPSDARYCAFSVAVAYGTTYNNDICINISDASRNGTYEPYNAHSYPLANVTLRGIPKWDNGLYYDGDEYNADGTVNRRYGIVDMGTLTWGLSGGIFYAILPAAPKSDGNCHCGRYKQGTGNDLAWGSEDKIMALGWIIANNCINIRDLSYSDATTFKASLNGVYLVYELETPTTETADPFTSVQICDADGTEEFVSNSIVPTGHETKYAKDIKGVLEEIADAPTTNGTYILKATVSASGTTYEWVAE